MKLPLRVTAGFVVYLAIWFALTPLVVTAREFIFQFPAEGVVSLVLALVAFIALWFLFYRRFLRWCDAGLYQ